MKLRWSAVCAALSLAAPAHTLETDLKFNGVLAGSYADFSADVSDDESGFENNASFVGLTGSIAQSGIKAFLFFEHGLERYNSVNPIRSRKRVREFFGGVSGRYGTLS